MLTDHEEFEPTTAERTDTMLAVRFSGYGGPDVLEVLEVARPKPSPSQVLVRVVTADINPGESRIRQGEFEAMWPATFPEGQGNTLAGVAASVGSDVAGFTKATVSWDSHRDPPKPNTFWSSQKTFFRCL